MEIGIWKDKLVVSNGISHLILTVRRFSISESFMARVPC